MNRKGLSDKAQQGLQLLENPVFKEAFDAERERIITELERVKLVDPAEALELLRGLQTLKNIKRELVMPAWREKAKGKPQKPLN